MTEARPLYGEAIRARRRGTVSEANADTPFVDVKPEFYADAKLLTDGILDTFVAFKEIYPPYGLVDRQGNPIESLQSSHPNQLLRLEMALSSTIYRAFEVTQPHTMDCPYHPVLAAKLGRKALKPRDFDSNGIDALREVCLPGGVFAPATIVNLLKRIPAMSEAHGITIPYAKLAQNSKFTLLREPLMHPQQWAKAFTFCLTGGYGISDTSFDRRTFFPDELIKTYTAPIIHGQKICIGWSQPTENFTLRANVNVVSRVKGSERVPEGKHVTKYSTGTRLGDIKTDEPTIGCPGKQVAYAMYDRAIDVVEREGLW